MTSISISTITDATGNQQYHASAGDKQSIGTTIGEAIDAVVAQLTEASQEFVLIPRSTQPDDFFTTEQQQRLGVLMEEWRQVRDTNERFPEAKQKELDALVEAELRASGHRLSALMSDA